MNMEALKYEIFAKIVGIQDEAILQKIKELLQSISNENDLFNRVIKPIRETISIEDLIKEQNYNGFDRDGFNNLVSEMKIEDPIDELLELAAK
jgi:hypothetical protein